MVKIAVIAASLCSAALAPAARAADVDLGREITLAAVVAEAVANNPDLREAQARAAAAQARAAAAGRLPDLEVQAIAQAVPIPSPLSYDEADMLMIGVRQSIPAPGVRGARARAGEADALIAAEAFRARERDVVAGVKRAYWEYYRADRTWNIRRETIGLARRLAELARIAYEAGRGTQQDVLRTAVEVARLESDLATDEGAVRSAQVTLNTFMGRDPDSFIGPPVEAGPEALQVPLDDLDELLEVERPEVASARRAVERSSASLEAARASATRPGFMLGVDYNRMPTDDMEKNRYSLMVAVNLPWLNPARRDDVREAERTRAAEERALESVRNAARFQLRDAMARYHSARVSFDALDRDILPMARRSFESAQGAFGAVRVDALGLLDALRSYLAVQLERARALAALETALADLERAVGSDIAKGMQKPNEGKRS